ncbi:DUF2273 domain-containing protein [Staphylococcus lutrae]|uniref:DUF2273 domain-containing protein n=1 Tax=Staphylococcus lutrae TaxID=155085 RepID=A0AAC9RTB3_9STAP|nr:DUF2273 domain-containing protein [Staphylococcus lutrae]ARJ50335.1 hypothetical protein B5P37_02915 [Staphylococcus lutrae]PNZ36558.1 DUF2273 domain-containing protein [Staphylococcus lutrae]
MSNEKQNGQGEREAVEQFVQTLKHYKWRLIGFFFFLVIAILFLTLGFWKTILIIVLCLIGIGLGYIKDRTQDFLNLLNRLS